MLKYFHFLNWQRDLHWTETETNFVASDGPAYYTIPASRTKGPNKRGALKREHNEYFPFIILQVYAKHCTRLCSISVTGQGQIVKNIVEVGKSGKVFVQQETQIKNSSVICAWFVLALNMQIQFFFHFCCVSARESIEKRINK